MALCAKVEAYILNQNIYVVYSENKGRIKPEKYNYEENLSAEWQFRFGHYRNA